MTANEPPNPYTPGNALADEVRAEATWRRPSRVLAAATSLLAYPLVGAGLFILGRRRRFAIWVTVGLLLGVAMIVGVRLPDAKLFTIGLAGLVAAAALAVIDSAVAKPADGIGGGRAIGVALAVILTAKGGALAVRYTLAEAYSMPSGSMLPTLRVGDHLFIKKGRGGIGRGDVIVFEYPRDRSTVYIKRVIAMGGDTVEVKNGIVSVNGAELSHGEILNEPNPCPGETGLADCIFARETSGAYTHTIMFTGHVAPDAPPVVVPEGHVYVLGDNRDNSSDSRQWGTVPIDHIKGTATVIYWSRDLSRVGSAID